MLIEIDKDKLNNVIETYKCLVVACDKMPGAKIETLFSSSALKSLKEEQSWLTGIRSEIIYNDECRNTKPQNQVKKREVLETTDQ